MDETVEIEAETADAVADAEAKAEAEAEAEAEERRLSLEAQVELLESLSDESLLPLLQEQVAQFNFPKQVSVRIRKMTDNDAQLMNRFLKVDSITPVSRKITEVVYTVKATRFESEIFHKKHETIRKELERVRSVLANRRQWFQLYGECVGVMQEREAIHDEVRGLDEYIDEYTPDEDNLDLDPDPIAEKELANVNRRKEEVVREDGALRKKEYALQMAMKKLDEAKRLLVEQGIAFAEDESWRAEAAQESLDSLLAKVVVEEPELEDGDVAPTNSPQGEEADGYAAAERARNDGEGPADSERASKDAVGGLVAKDTKEAVGGKGEADDGTSDPA